MADGSVRGSGGARLIGIAAAMMVPLLMMAPVRSDNISPKVTAAGRVYSTEPPNSAHYGTGISGRMIEASELRYLGEQDLNTGDLDDAVRKLGKAVQLDAGTPSGHVLYARAITAKFFSNKGEVDEKLLSNCLYEWRMLWRHDADQLEQQEARAQAIKLGKIAKALAKKKKEAARQMLAERQGDLDAAASDRRAKDKAQSRMEKFLDQGPSGTVDEVISE